MNVLIVEDDRVLSLMLQKMVIQMGYKVVDCVTTGEEAVEITFNDSVDLILMDIMLEGEIDGIEAMHQIREKSDVSVIYVTGNSDPLTIKRARETDFKDFLIKPVNFESLEHSIGTLHKK